jgi:hypothetical protein
MSSKFLRGALIQMTQTFGATMPNVIIFQYNPETLTHGWSPAETDYQPGQGTNPLAVRGLPAETFSFTLVMDANDQIAALDALAIGSGIYSRLAALEMLLFPTVGDEQAASLTAVVSTAADESDDDSMQSQTVPAGDLPVVLFVWGGARIVPVRVQSLSVTETLYDALLNPTHAEATITLQVLTKQDLANATGPLADVARGAYDYTHGARQTFAIANLANARDAAIGVVPFL